MREPPALKPQVGPHQGIAADDAVRRPPLENQADVRVGAAAQFDTVTEVGRKERVAVELVPPPPVPVVAPCTAPVQRAECRRRQRPHDAFPTMLPLSALPELEFPLLRLLPPLPRHVPDRIGRFAQL